jgi:hypothetical protein
MKKPIGFSIIFLFTFFGIFIYLYRSSGKFRKSIVSAFLSALIIFSAPLQSNAHGADAFTPAEHSRPANRPGLFSSKSNDPGKPDKPTGNGGAGDDDDNGKIPQYQQPKSVQKTREQIEELKLYVREFDEDMDTDSASESEEDKCSLDETLNRPIYDRRVGDGSILEDLQVRKKFTHAPDFGILGNPNRENYELFKDRIIDHIQNPSTRIKKGTYKKNIEVLHYFNEETGLNVMIRQNDKTFLSGWKLNNQQLQNVKDRGAL